MQLSDTFLYKQIKKIFYSLTVLIIASFLMHVNWFNFPFFLKFPCKK